MTLLNAMPSITEWIQAIGVLLGVPATIWGIFKLFRKDREQERKLNSLESIANEQNEIVKQLKDQADQMIIQSGHLQYQASLMKDSNKLLESQIEIQTNAYLHEKGLKEDKLAFDKQKRLTEIKPFFTRSSSGSGPQQFHFDLDNKGGDAQNLSIKEINTDFVYLEPLKKNLRIDRGDKVTMRGRPRADKTYFNSHQVTFEIALIFQDIDGNEYSQNIRKIQNGKFIVEDPILEEKG